MFDNPVAIAFLFGGLSALSLPLGAVLGLWLKPSMKVTAAVMAFGAGSLFSALALELVVPAMDHFPTAPQEGFKFLGLGAMLGCLAFIGMDQVFSNMGSYLRKASTLSSKLRIKKKSHYEDLLKKLSQVDLLVNLPPDEVRGIVSHVERRVFPKGSTIFRQGDPGDSLFLIESGKVRVHSHQTEHGEEKDVAWLGKGDTVGEMALLTGQPRVATVEAEENVETWEIHKDDFDELLEVSPNLRKELEALVTKRQTENAPMKRDASRAEAWAREATVNLDREVSDPTSTEIAHAAQEHKKGGANVALAIWLGIALDGVPESLVIGASMEGSAVSIALVAGLFMANLPESMSSAVVMKNQGGKNSTIIMMWASLMVMTAVGAAIGNAFVSEVPKETQAFMEGTAAGAMLAMIAQTMLPEAFEHGGWLTGLLTVVGFLAAIFVGTFDSKEKPKDHHTYLPPARIHQLRETESPVFRHQQKLAEMGLAA